MSGCSQGYQAISNNSKLTVSKQFIPHNSLVSSHTDAPDLDMYFRTTSHHLHIHYSIENEQFTFPGYIRLEVLTEGLENIYKQFSVVKNKGRLEYRLPHTSNPKNRILSFKATLYSSDGEKQVVCEHPAYTEIGIDAPNS